MNPMQLKKSDSGKTEFDQGSKPPVQVQNVSPKASGKMHGRLIHTGPVSKQMKTAVLPAVSKNAVPLQISEKSPEVGLISNPSVPQPKSVSAVSISSPLETELSQLGPTNCIRKLTPAQKENLDNTFVRALRLQTNFRGRAISTPPSFHQSQETAPARGRSESKVPDNDLKMSDEEEKPKSSPQSSQIFNKGKSFIASFIKSGKEFFREEEGEVLQNHGAQNGEISNLTASGKVEVKREEKIRGEWTDTEASYKQQLEVLAQCKSAFEDRNNFFDFIDEKKGLDDTSGVPRDGLKASGQAALEKLFEEITKLKIFSDTFLPILRELKSFEEFVSVIAGMKYSTFYAIADRYDAYLRFQKKLTKSEHEALVKRLNKLIPAEASRASKLQFESYAIAPVQRLPRYMLLIRELIKAIEKQSAFAKQLELLNIAYNNSEEASQKMNDAVRGTVILNPSVLEVVFQSLCDLPS